jgi:hypothetical protein
MARVGDVGLIARVPDRELLVVCAGAVWLGPALAALPRLPWAMRARVEGAWLKKSLPTSPRRPSMPATPRRPLRSRTTARVALEIAATAATVYSARESQRRAQNQQRDAYNASLKDRYVMLRSATEPRQRGARPAARQRPAGVRRQLRRRPRASRLRVMLAAHEIDAVEAFTSTTNSSRLDGSGNVTAVNRRDLFTLTSAGDTFTLSAHRTAATVAADRHLRQHLGHAGRQRGRQRRHRDRRHLGQTGTVTITYQPAQSPWMVTQHGRGATRDDHAGRQRQRQRDPGRDAGPAGTASYVVYSKRLGDDNNAARRASTPMPCGGQRGHRHRRGWPAAPSPSPTRCATSNSSRARAAYLGAAGQVADAGHGRRAAGRVDELAHDDGPRLPRGRVRLRPGRLSPAGCRTSAPRCAAPRCTTRAPASPSGARTRRC